MRPLFNPFAFLFCIALACSEPAVNPEGEETPVTNITRSASKSVKHVIPKGKHESDQSGFFPLKASILRFKALFDSSAIYKASNPNNQADINKLYGLADCGVLHQVNSARFGWRWFNGRLEIWAYCYVNTVRSYVFVDTVSLNSYHEFSIQFKDKSYVFTINNTSITMPRACNGTANGYRLFPYFGGDETAPHDITIFIDEP